MMRIEITENCMVLLYEYVEVTCYTPTRFWCHYKVQDIQQGQEEVPIRIILRY